MNKNSIDKTTLVPQESKMIVIIKRTRNIDDILKSRWERRSLEKFCRKIKASEYIMFFKDLNWYLKIKNPKSKLQFGMCIYNNYIDKNSPNSMNLSNDIITFIHRRIFIYKESSMFIFDRAYEKIKENFTDVYIRWCESLSLEKNIFKILKE